VFAPARRRIQAASVPAKQFVRRLHHLAVDQAIVGAAKATFALALLSTTTPAAPVVVGLLAFAVYNGNSLTDGREDAVNRPAKAEFVTRLRRPILVGATTAAVAAVLLATLAGGVHAGLVAIFSLAAAVAYSFAPVPALGLRRVKEVFVLNSTVVALAWAVPVAFLPVVMGGTVKLNAAIAICGFMFLRTFISVEVFNLRDVAGDRASDVATMPVVLGPARMKGGLLLLEVLSVLLIASALAAGMIPAGPALVTVPTIAFSIVLTATIGDGRDPRARCVAKDAEYLVLGAIGLIAL